MDYPIPLVTVMSMVSVTVLTTVMPKVSIIALMTVIYEYMMALMTVKPVMSTTRPPPPPRPRGRCFEQANPPPPRGDRK
jgi:hypothetical protein